VPEIVVVADARGVPLPADTPAVVPSPADELAGDGGLASGCGVGLAVAELAVAELAGVLVALADVPTIGDFDGIFDAVGAHLLTTAGSVGVGVLLGLEVAVALDVALPVAFGLLVPLGLVLALGLVLELWLTDAVGLAGELGGGVDGVDSVDLADGEAGEVDDEDEDEDDGAAEVCGQDPIGVGWWFAADVVSAPAPPVRARPPPPAAAGLDVLAALRPSRAADTDEVSAWRSGGTEARTAPAANTAQASAIAGLISASRQSLGRRACPRPAP
jgi:hypothetical protein